MGFFKAMVRFFHYQFLRLSWLALLLVLAVHAMLSWYLMYLADERQLLAPVDWLYFYMTTATTIGYGDFTPDNKLGELFAALFIMPGGVVLLAAVLGKLSSFFIAYWRKSMQGLGSYPNLTGHIVIFGWHRDHTPKMIELIYGDKHRQHYKVVLCTSKKIENPLPEKVLFIRSEHLNDPLTLRRAGVVHAARIIVFRDSDDRTLATCLSIAATKTHAHIVAWFENQEMVTLLQSHCPQIECDSNISMELLVRSAQDPGSSRVQQQLLSTLVGPTQYSMRVPDNFAGTSFGQLLEFFKVRYEAIVLGVADSTTGNNLHLNPPSSYRVKAAQVIYYIAAQRICGDEVLWRDIPAN